MALTLSLLPLSTKPGALLSLMNVWKDRETMENRKKIENEEKMGQLAKERERGEGEVERGCTKRYRKRMRLWQHTVSAMQISKQ